MKCTDLNASKRENKQRNREEKEKNLSHNNDNELN